MINLIEVEKENSIQDYNSFDYTPLVSVIIATYRRVEYLKGAVSSVLAQTYKPLEVIVVDDNADDIWNKKVEGIINAAKKATDVPIVYIKNEDNLGSAEARNTGIEAALGEYITFLDDDDVYLPLKIEKQIFHMIEQQSDFCITDLHLYDKNDKLVEMRVRNYILSTSVESLLKYHLMFHMTGTDTFMFRKDYLLKIGGFPPIDVGDEFYLMIKAIENGGKFSYLKGCEVRAIVHTEAGGLSSGDGKIVGEAALYEFKKKYFYRLNPYEIRFIKMRHYAVLAFAYLRKKQLFLFILNAIKSFVIAPVYCVKLLFSLKYLNTKK